MTGGGREASDWLFRPLLPLLASNHQSHHVISFPPRGGSRYRGVRAFPGIRQASSNHRRPFHVYAEGPTAHALIVTGTLCTST